MQKIKDNDIRTSASQVTQKTHAARALRWLGSLAALSAAMLCAAPVQAAGHYVPGVEGIQAASVPGPGMYFLGYAVNYNINRLTEAPGNNEGTVNALALRGAWITQATFLGANYGIEAIVPMTAKSFTFNGIGYAGSSRGVGDVYVSPLVLGWHGAQWDLSFGLGQWLNVGTFSATDPTSPGNGYSSTMLSFGGTYYPDTAKQWSVSVLMRAEKNYSQRQTGITPGNGLVVEWGIARHLTPTTQLGLVGYYQGQISNDSGDGASPMRPRKAAVGVQFDWMIPSEKLFLKVAGYTEYTAGGGSPKGNLIRLALVKAF
ncbi:transporter [Pandoraea pnomenusa]|uniref:SphA family protein n=1 Tax=Pandoraea pnomenusa TaxID=93220 RepID=UPI003342B6AE